MPLPSGAQMRPSRTRTRTMISTSPSPPPPHPLLYPRFGWKPPSRIMIKIMSRTVPMDIGYSPCSAVNKAGRNRAGNAGIGPNQIRSQGERVMAHRVISGIYCIRNVVSGRVYVGSAISILKRWGEHRRYLQKKNHHSEILQSSWNKHGEHAFVFEIIERVTDLSMLVAREQHWIDQLKTTCTD